MGQGIGVIDQVQSTAMIVDRMRTEYECAAGTLAGAVGEFQGVPRWRLTQR